ncbi:MAG: hypothetical protein Q7U98_11375 [Methylicorpusculum sp.]|uniref:hypothetical protein n=1 Tax=Methylicorpusculum sp. TaxID=2713644 RepID=UPI002718046F|nr:hypothetical protein [Methylicorpusculum sp.]MDO8939747.1 hypothetical protein [Methylicorpusculum sp.]MDP2201899.1 hypothetical protein [Methylicorpusculum sp.]
MFLNTLRRIALTLTLALITGCTQTHSSYWQNRFPTHFNNDPYTQIDVDELLSFGANMANVPAASRAELCKSLLMRQKSSQDAGIQLHLMVGRLLSDSCGSIPSILEGIRAIPADYLSDTRLQRLVSINTEALKRMEYSPGKRSSIERSSQRAKPLIKSKDTNETKPINQDENRLLREKLEAIRSMEKQLDESGDGSQ